MTPKTEELLLNILDICAGNCRPMSAYARLGLIEKSVNEFRDEEWKLHEADKPLSDAGLFLRKQVAEGNEAMDPWSFIPCAREHEKDRLCILPDGHPALP